jgi:hypothetical protein
MTVRINLETYQLQVGNDKVPMRRSTVSVTHSDQSPAETASTEVRRTEPEAKRGWPEEHKDSLTGGAPHKLKKERDGVVSNKRQKRQENPQKREIVVGQ